MIIWRTLHVYSNTGETKSKPFHADEKDVYRVFADAYGPDYKNPDWEKFLTDAGGADNLDCDKLAAAIGYEDSREKCPFHKGLIFHLRQDKRMQMWLERRPATV